MTEVYSSTTELKKETCSIGFKYNNIKKYVKFYFLKKNEKYDFENGAFSGHADKKYV